MDLGCILEVEMKKFANGLNMRVLRKGESCNILPRFLVS